MNESPSKIEYNKDENNDIKQEISTFRRILPQVNFNSCFAYVIQKQSNSE